MRKVAAKLLRRSDLSFFHYHYHRDPTSKQKAINLNADVFVDQFFPSLGELPPGERRLPINLSIIGPSSTADLVLARKVVRSPGSKNWRLNGELIQDPEDDSTRFHALQPGDFAVIEFQGSPHPVSARLMLVPAASAGTRELAALLRQAIGTSGMIALSGTVIDDIVTATSASLSPLALEFLSGAALEDAAIGGSWGIDRLLQTPGARTMTLEDLHRAREAAEEAGAIGEELVNEYLRARQARGDITQMRWASAENPISPFDFEFVDQQAGRLVRIDVKSTNGKFTRPIHISLAELRLIVEKGDAYHLYRVFDATESGGRLRICDNPVDVALNIFKVLQSFPKGVTADSVSIDPLTLSFGNELTLLGTTKTADEEID